MANFIAIVLFVCLGFVSFSNVTIITWLNGNLSIVLKIIGQLIKHSGSLTSGANYLRFDEYLYIYIYIYIQKTCDKHLICQTGPTFLGTEGTSAQHMNPNTSFSSNSCWFVIWAPQPFWAFSRRNTEGYFPQSIQ